MSVSLYWLVWLAKWVSTNPGYQTRARKIAIRITYVLRLCGFAFTKRTSVKRANMTLVKFRVAALRVNHVFQVVLHLTQDVLDQ